MCYYLHKWGNTVTMFPERGTIFFLKRYRFWTEAVHRRKFDRNPADIQWTLGNWQTSRGNPGYGIWDFNMGLGYWIWDLGLGYGTLDWDIEYRTWKWDRDMGTQRIPEVRIHKRKQESKNKGKNLFFLGCFLCRECLFFLFFLTIIVFSWSLSFFLSFFFFSWSLSWSKTCFLVFFYKFRPQLRKKNS